MTPSLRSQRDNWQGAYASERHCIGDARALRLIGRLAEAILDPRNRGHRKMPEFATLPSEFLERTNLSSFFGPRLQSAIAHMSKLKDIPLDNAFLERLVLSSEMRLASLLVSGDFPFIEELCLDLTAVIHHRRILSEVATKPGRAILRPIFGADRLKLAIHESPMMYSLLAELASSSAGRERLLETEDFHSREWALHFGVRVLGLYVRAQDRALAALFFYRFAPAEDCGESLTLEHVRQITKLLRRRHPSWAEFID